MRYLLVAAVAAAFALPATALASPTKWSDLTLAGKQQLLVQTIHRDRTAIRWWLTHRQRAVSPFFTVRVPLGIPTRRCPALGIQTPRQICVRAENLHHATATLATVQAAIIAAEVPSYLRERGLGLPPAWFRSDIYCIEGGESTHGLGSSNLYGMLDGWFSAGGGRGYAIDGRPSAWEASPTEQLNRTWILYNMYGWSPWSTAHGCGLR